MRTLRRILLGLSFLLTLTAAPSMGSDAPPLVLLRSGAKPSEKASASGDKFFNRVKSAITSSGIGFDIIQEDALSPDNLKHSAMVVLPYNPKLSGNTLVVLKQFIERGGKLLAFYTVDYSLYAPLGVASVKLREQSRRGEFANIVFDKTALPLAPENLRQNSWNVLELTPSKDATILARWADAQNNIGPIAVLKGRGGAIFTHVLLANNIERAGEMIFALSAELVGDAILKEPAQKIIESLEHVSRSIDLEMISKMSMVLASGTARSKEFAQTMVEVNQELKTAKRAYAAGAYKLAHARAKIATQKFNIARASLQVPKTGEMRAVWVRNPEKINWSLAAPKLAKMGFNVVFANYVRGGIAAYVSDTLLLSPINIEDGADVSSYINECRRAGLEAHIWWSVMFLDDTPLSLSDELGRTGRLMVGVDGTFIKKNNVGWFCPTNSTNLKSFEQVTHELVTQIEPDGIHLDYMRLPNETSCLCANCKKLFAHEGDWPSSVMLGANNSFEFRNFRRGAIDNILSIISTTSRKLRPQTLISAAVFPRPADTRETLAQDWVSWGKKGLVDFFVPMNYTASGDVLASWIKEQNRRLGGSAKLISGIGVRSGQSKLKTPQALFEQIQITREFGADGFCIFQYDSFFEDTHADALEGGFGRDTSQRTLFHGVDVEWNFNAIGGLKVDGVVSIELQVGLNALFKKAGYSLQQNCVVYIETPTGQKLTNLGAGPEVGAKRRYEFNLPSQKFRIAVIGTLVDGDGRRFSFVERSRLYAPLSPAQVELQRELYRPRGAGPKVAVLGRGYGSAGILASLRASGEFKTYGVKDLECLHLMAPNRPDVIIIPQRRDAAELNEFSVVLIRSFASAGGGVLLTHDAVGYRYHPVIFPHISPGGIGREASHEIRAVKDTGLGDVLGLEAIRHTHYDHVIMAIGERARTIATAETGAVVLLGRHGSGRVLACGVAIGLNKKEESHIPNGAEAQLLYSFVRYLLPQEGRNEWQKYSY